MKIIFNAMNCGLGNNGGTATIIKSANILIELGHKVFVIDSMENQHAWNVLNAEHIIVKDFNMVPDADAIIATGYNTVKSTIELPKRCGIKTHWIRAWEHWQMSNDEIYEKVLKPPTIKLVNSLCLRDKLKRYNTDSYIVRPGYDFDELYPTNQRQSSGPVVLGGLYREGKHGIRKRTTFTLEMVKLLKQKYNDLILLMFGSEKPPNDNTIDIYIRSPSKERKNEIYNTCDIWVAPTMSEGLHLPPAEAMLTECPVVGTNAELSGMQDYLINDQTGLVSDNTFESFVETTEKLINDRELRVKLGKNAKQKILEIGDRKKNMNMLVNLLESLV